MAGRRKPLRAVSLVFGGFVTLVVLSQLSAHFFAQAVPKHLVAQNEAVILSIQQTAGQLALAASALGLIFAGAVLVITKQTVSADIDVYRANGLSLSSAFFRMLRTHSTRPLEWVALAAAASVLVDLDFGLDALVPIGLALAFALMMVVWLAFLTSSSFSHKGFEGSSGGRSG